MLIMRVKKVGFLMAAACATAIGASGCEQMVDGTVVIDVAGIVVDRDGNPVTDKQGVLTYEAELESGIIVSNRFEGSSQVIDFDQTTDDNGSFTATAKVHYAGPGFFKEPPFKTWIALSDGRKAIGKTTTDMAANAINGDFGTSTFSPLLCRASGLTSGILAHCQYSATYTVERGADMTFFKLFRDSDKALAGLSPVHSGAPRVSDRAEGRSLVERVIQLVGPERSTESSQGAI